MVNESVRSGVRISVETVIARPRAEVAGYAMDPANDRSWIGVGTRVERVAQFLGRRMEYVNEIVDYAPPERLAMRSVQAPFPMTVSYEFEEVDGGTRVRIRTAGDAVGFYRLAGPLLAAAVRRSIASDLARLRRVLEARG
jgi:Polyketide cyclase / dehydrase and lipid transport